MSDDAEAERRTAAKLAGYLGCSGTHEHDGRILPCRTHDELLARSKAAENFTKSADPRRRRKRKVSSRRGKGWENLRERPTSSLATGGAGITSGSPGSEITDSGPTGSTGTAVSGGIMGGVVDGSFGVASLEGSGILDAKEDGRRRSEGSRRPVPVPVERKTAKALPRDADHDGWIEEGTPARRFVGIDAAVEGVEHLAHGVTEAVSGHEHGGHKPGGEAEHAASEAEHAAGHAAHTVESAAAKTPKVQPNTIAGHGHVALKDRGHVPLKDLVGTTAAPKAPNVHGEEVTAEKLSGEADHVERIAKENERITKALEDVGGSVFDRSDAATMEKFREESIKGGYGAYAPSAVDTEAAHAESKRRFMKAMTKIRDHLAGGKREFGETDKSRMPPEVKDLIESHTDEELFAIAEEQAVKFHQTVSRDIRVRVRSDRVDAILDDVEGKYRTTHEVPSEQSGPTMRASYEASMGFPLDTPPELRPASGFVTHPDWQKGMEDLFTDVHGRPPTPWDDLPEEAGDFNTLGEIKFILHEGVADRSAFGNGDSLNSAMQPARFGSDDPATVMPSIMTVNHREHAKGEELVLSLLRSHVEGNFLNYNSEPYENWDYRIRTLQSKGMPIASATGLAHPQYHEALIPGAFHLDEVKEVKARYSVLGSTGSEYHDLPKLVEEFLSPESLKEYGLTPEEISKVRAMFAGVEGRGTVNQLGGGQTLGAALKDVMQFRKANERRKKFESHGIKVTTVCDHELIQKLSGGEGKDMWDWSKIPEERRGRFTSMEEALGATFNRRLGDALKKVIADPAEAAKPKRKFG